MNYYTVYNPPETGKAPPSSRPKETIVEEQFPLREQLGRWFFGPLSELSGHQAFIAMILAIILLEKWLRVSRGYGDEQFSEGSKPIRELAELYGVTPDVAYRFWQDWRNGLLHRAMPQTEHFEGYSMSADYPEALRAEGTHIYVNPWRFRDRVIDLLAKDRDLWRDSQAPLAKEFKVVGNI